MFLETLKTGACHRFFCVKMTMGMAVLGLVVMPLRAQIVLPDDPEVEKDSEGQVASTDGEKISEEELSKTIRELQGSQRLQLNFAEDLPPASPGGALLREQEEQYKQAPSMLKVSGELISGERFWGEMQNRSFEVKNTAGTFPVLLHQLETFVLGEGEGHFTFRFIGGDFIEGTPGLTLLIVRLPDGGERQFRLTELKAVRVTEK